MWQNEMTLMLRFYIKDLDCPPKYTDQRLQELLIISAMQIQEEVDVTYHGDRYQVSLETMSVLPDPTFGDSRNQNFMLLTGYKAAAILTMGEFNVASSQNILVRDGGSEVDMRNLAQAKKSVADFYKNGYEDLRMRYALNNYQPFAVISPPAIIGNYGCSNYGGGYYGGYMGFRDQPYFA